MIAGVGLFGTLSGFLANTFLSPRKKNRGAGSERLPTPTIPRPGSPRSERMLEAQEQATADLKAKLDEIDNLL